MSKIALSANNNGTGIFTIASPSSNTNQTMTLSDLSGSVVINEGTGIFKINSAGNVGIGTATPTERLHIATEGGLNANDALLRLGNVDSFNSFLLGYYGTGDVTDDAPAIYTGSSSSATGQAGHIAYKARSGASPRNHIFYTGATPTERMRISANGNVGIGTSNPVAQLHISGATNPTAVFTGAITSSSLVDQAGILDVTGVTSGTIAVGDLIYGAGVSPITKVLAFGTGTGTTGTYTVSVYQNVSSTTMYASSGSTSKIRISETDTEVAEGQSIGTIEFFTNDSFSGGFSGNPPPSAGVGAYISAVAEGTNVNASLVFGTRRAVSSSSADANERLRIASSGQIGIGGANYGTSGQTIVSAGSGAAPAWGTLPVAGGGTGVTTAPAAAAVLMGFTTTATAAGTTVLTNASSQFQVFTGATTQTITLPVTSTLGTGWSFHIVNNSTGTLTVNSSGGNLVISIIAGLTAMVTCIGTTLTTAADWEAGYTDFQTITGTGAVVLGTAPTITNAVISQSNAVRAAGTLALAFGTNQFVQVTPNAAGAFTTTVPVVGTTCTLIVLTSGTTSYSMTFGTGFRSTAALATGTVTAQRFVLQFVSDGTSLIPTIRTAAIA